MNTFTKEIADRGSDAVKAAQKSDYSDLQNEIDNLRTQIETLMADGARAGRKQIERAQGALSDGMQVVEHRASEQVRERPIQSLALAVGVGALLTLLLRR